LWKSHEIHKYTKRGQSSESYNAKENGSLYLVKVTLLMVILIFKTCENYMKWC